MKRFWVWFFMFWPLVAVWACWVAPSRGWWFPSAAMSPLGQRIDDLFNLILIIVTVVFVGTQIGLGYVLWTGARRTDEGNTERAWFSHGSHNLEVMWTIIPAGVLLFIALYQMDVWAQFRVKDYFPAEVRNRPAAEVTARQFEWRIRYPGLDAEGHPLPLELTPQPTDLYTVNDLRLPSGRPVMIHLRTDDVQHSFFLPELRVKQDAVPGLVIPIWFETPRSDTYTLLCAELCGWGHYKMRARLVTEPETDWLKWLGELQTAQEFDGVPAEAAPQDE